MSTPIPNPGTASPQAIDLRCATLDTAWTRMALDRSHAVEQLHWLVEGGPVKSALRGVPRHWRLSGVGVLREARRQLDLGTLTLLDADTARDALDKEERLRGLIDWNRAEYRRYDHEHAQRLWPRYFRALTDPGHIHADMCCGTCYPETRFGWEPSASGLLVERAIEKFGAVLCSICFPGAPVNPVRTNDVAAQTE